MGNGAPSSRDPVAIRRDALPIMAVDDEPENLELLERTLGDKYEIRTFSDGSQALEALKERPYSLIISDHRMPKMTGVELLSLAAEITPDTGRILLTGFADLETALEAVNTGRVNSILRKPIDRATLVGEVERCLSFHRLLNENRWLAEELFQRNEELSNAKHLLESDLDARTKDLVETKKLLEEMVVRDALTGLFNQRYFQDRIEQEVAMALRHGYETSLIFCDIDNFKVFNDTNGHLAGDKLLCSIGDILRMHTVDNTDAANLRKGDILVRYGGDEFVIILPHTNKEGAGIVGERLRAAVFNQEFQGEDILPDGRITVSIGIAECPADARSAFELINKSDEALYQAKHSGRNCVRATGGDIAFEPGDSGGFKTPKTDERIEALENAFRRERKIREELEKLAEDKTREQYYWMERLKQQQSVLLAQNEKLSTLGRLSAGIAHEINNAINFVRGNVQHMANYLEAYELVLKAYRDAVLPDETLSEHLREFERKKRLDYIQSDLPKLLAAISTGIERATSIVRDIGIFSRSADHDIQWSDLDQALEIALTLATNRLKHKKVSVEKDPPEKLRAKCNQGRLSQVFLNLLVNASDVTEDGEEIQIRMKTSEDDPDEIIVEVKDPGPGIPPDVKHHLFEPFYTTKSAGEGTGLGLYVCKQLVEEHGGRIWCDSIPGEGASFFVSIPRNGPTEKRSSEGETVI